MATEHERNQNDDIKEDIKKLTDSNNSLVFDNERIIKPALEEIKQTLKDGVYVTQKEAKPMFDKVDKIDERTKNYPLVEKIVFGLVGIVLTAFATALVLYFQGGPR